MFGPAAQPGKCRESDAGLVGNSASTRLNNGQRHHLHPHSVKSRKCCNDFTSTQEGDKTVTTAQRTHSHHSCCLTLSLLPLPLATSYQLLLLLYLSLYTAANSGVCIMNASDTSTAATTTNTAITATINTTTLIQLLTSPQLPSNAACNDTYTAASSWYIRVGQYDDLYCEIIYMYPPPEKCRANYTMVTIIIII